MSATIFENNNIKINYIVEEDKTLTPHCYLCIHDKRQRGLFRIMEETEDPIIWEALMTLVEEVEKKTTGPVSTD